MLSERGGGGRQTVEKISMCVRSAHVTLCAWRLCDMLQLSIFPGIKNQIQSHLTSYDLWSVTEKHLPYRCVHTCTPAYTTLRGTKQQDTHSSPGQQRGRK